MQGLRAWPTSTAGAFHLISCFGSLLVLGVLLISILVFSCTRFSSRDISCKYLDRLICLSLLQVPAPVISHYSWRIVDILTLTLHCVAPVLVVGSFWHLILTSQTTRAFRLVSDRGTLEYSRYLHVPYYLSERSRSATGRALVKSKNQNYFILQPVLQYSRCVLFKVETE